MPEFIEVRTESQRWQVQPGLERTLLSVAGLRLEEWLACGAAQLVKHASYRTVYRVTLPEVTFYLKHNRLPDRRSWWRELLRPSKARTEFELARALTARGVPTVEPLALGERLPGRGPGESFLLTRALEEVCPLGQFLVKDLPRRGALRAVLAQVLGRFVATMHSAGVIHHDLHPDNLLLCLRSGEPPTLALVDLQAVRIHSALDWGARRDNLVLLNRWFILRAERTDRLRFWQAYWEAWQGPGRPGRAEAARDLEIRTRASNRRFWVHLDQRCLANNRRYRRVRARGVRGYAVADLDPTLLNTLTTNPDAPFAGGTRLLKDSRSSTVAELDWQGASGRQRLIYKRFRLTTWSAPWLSLVRRSPALRSWIHGHALRLRWLPTPRPLAVLFRTRAGLEREGYLLMEKVENAVDLHQWGEQLRDRPSSEARGQKQVILEQVARLVRNLHERHYSHRDLKAVNILVHPERAPAQEKRASDPALNQVWLIDLVGMRRHKTVQRRRRVQNLARLNASFLNHPACSRTDRLRFLRIYLCWGIHGRGGWKDWWRAIAAATQAKQRRNARSGRPLF